PRARDPRGGRAPGRARRRDREDDPPLRERARARFAALSQGRRPGEGHALRGKRGPPRRDRRLGLRGAGAERPRASREGGARSGGAGGPRGASPVTGGGGRGGSPAPREALMSGI